VGILLPGESRKNKLLATEDLSMWTITKTSLDSMQQLLGSDINHPQVITFFLGGIPAIPNHGRFMASWFPTWSFAMSRSKNGGTLTHKDGAIFIGLMINQHI
jgi:hypothetical protein